MAYFRPLVTGEILKYVIEKILQPVSSEIFKAAQTIILPTFLPNLFSITPVYVISLVKGLIAKNL